MPLGTVTSYADMGQAADAQERLSNIMDIAAASGNMKKGAHSRHIRSLKRRAKRTTTLQGNQNRGSQPLTVEAVEALGIEVVKVNG